MTKLYRVTVEFEYFVAAESDGGAEVIANKEFQAALHDIDTGSIFSVDEVSDVKTVNRDWRTSFPYGDNKGMTCEKILAASAPAAPPTTGETK
jgi:hypothetical protein